MEIVKFQRDFLDHGIHHLRPLKLKEVADRLGIHISTVSRAISGKYIQTPRGIFPMKFFFSGEISRSSDFPQGDASAFGGTDTGGSGFESQASVKARIREMIENEDKKKPLSDGEIAKRLQEEFGVKVARRTVTKYREQMGIPSSRVRREY